ncbi:hypothetical protein ABZX85_42420 [Streptomyces sp. NPDC004539]|uniref:hypothetical protein n=1 Tax=Streptomyces sp. NPDC004539 TaxID=3154280 RepID=UPI0033AA39EE
MFDRLCDNKPGIFEAAPLSRRVLVSSTSQALRAVAEAVESGHRVAVGGADLSGDRRGAAQPQRVVDLSPMNAVYFDEERRAFAVEAGARPSAVRHTLHERWGVVVPSLAGPDTCCRGCLPDGRRPEAARRLATEYLYAIEAVLVDAYGRTRPVVATRDPGDRHRDLWLAHRAVGAEHFGLVTRYWFRSPGAVGEDPAELLPQAPTPRLASAAVPHRRAEHPPASAGYVCEMCRSTAPGPRDVRGPQWDDLIAFDVLHCRGGQLVRGSAREADPFRDTVRGARSPRCRRAVRTRAAMTAWDPRGVFH